MEDFDAEASRGDDSLSMCLNHNNSDDHLQDVVLCRKLNPRYHPLVAKWGSCLKRLAIFIYRPPSQIRSVDAVHNSLDVDTMT